MKTVVANNPRSQNLNVTGGIPQGSILGPLPDVPVTRNFKYMLMVSKLNWINNWAKHNGFCLNPAETKLIPIYKRRISNLENISVRIGHTEIYGVKNVRNLGLTFNSTLNWTSRVLSVRFMAC